MERSYDIITSIMGSRAGENGKDLSSEEDCDKKKSSLKECSPKISTTTDQLMSILGENIENETITCRKPICIEPKPPRRRETTGHQVSNILQVHLQRGSCNVGGNAAAGVGNISEKYAGIASSVGKQKIPRPANAFMLFANEWRKKLAIQNPRESNKDISVRLGVLWKNMAKGIKEKYFALAREVDAEHKRKYPGEKKSARSGTA